MFSFIRSKSLRDASAYVALAALVVLAGATLTGCPPKGAVLNADPIGWQVPATAGEAYFEIWNSGSTGMAWTASVISGGSWLSIEDGESGYDDGYITVSFAANTQAASRTGQIRVTAPGASGSPMTLTILQHGTGGTGGDEIEGDWGGYWWYSGTEGNVYISWSFHDGEFSGAIPSAGATFGGTYSINAAANPKTIDMTVTDSNTSAWEVGKTYRGYYRIENGTMYRSQMFETRPAWSSSLLDPDEGIVFVATPTK